MPHSSIASQRLLDAPLALPDLTARQRTDVRAAQRTRDLVLRRHQDRKNLSKCKRAWETFEATLSDLLTPGQQTQHQQGTAARGTNSGALWAIEEGVCGPSTRPSRA